jgi:4-diphosphocytidyl-2-C-methyl-D-erythritol kinase
MSAVKQSARLRALAKINLSLKVLNKRPDGFHELRTIFQTISLADTLDVEFSPARRTGIEVSTNVDIPDNLVARAAESALDAMRLTGRVVFHLTKRIPVGGGLGGGSSDAAAVLLGLPVLAGRRIPLKKLTALAADLGSDVPFFLLGGTALGLGRGTELYPLPDAPPLRGLVVTPPVEVSTRAAYEALGRELTSSCQSNNMSSLRALSWSLGQGLSAKDWAALGENDFEAVALEHHPQLGLVRRKLRKLGAEPVMLSGSGSSLFGIFTNRSEVRRALGVLRDQRAAPFFLVSRARYRGLWQRSLRAHIDGEIWPPQSRYAR